MKPSSERRQDTVDVFRERLAQVVADSGMNRTAFAGRVGTDRSTLSQLLAAGANRLPRAETIVAIAETAQVSIDWLLGLSQEGQMRTDVVEEAVAIEHGAGSSLDSRLQGWHAAAAGYKIRYVPTSLPDLLKTEEVIRYEYRGYETVRPEGRIEQAEARLAYSRRPETDIEACTDFQALDAFAYGEGMWRGLEWEVRQRQLETIASLVDELYPTFRWFLYDGLERYAAPLTVFGAQRVALYAGEFWLVFNATDHIRALTVLFDDLIRAAVVQPTEIIGYVERLLGAGDNARVLPL